VQIIKWLRSKVRAFRTRRRTLKRLETVAGRERLHFTDGLSGLPKFKDMGRVWNVQLDDRNRDLEQANKRLIQLTLRVSELDQRNRKMEQANKRNYELAQRVRDLEKANQQLDQKNKKLENLTLTDSLTGSPNRRAMISIAEHPRWKELTAEQQTRVVDVFLASLKGPREVIENLIRDVIDTPGAGTWTLEEIMAREG
jgi:hypothetical protein